MSEHDRLVREYYLIHLKDAFRIIVDKGYDLYKAVDAYCTSEYGVKSSDGVARYMMDAPLSMALHGCGELVPAERFADITMAHWIAEVIIKFMDYGVKSYELVIYVKPSFLLEHFNPMHERTFPSLCRSVADKFGFELREM